MTIHDDLSYLDETEVADTCIKVLNALQDHQPPVQVAAIVSIHRLMLEVFNLDIRQEIERLERLMRDQELPGWDKKFDAVRAYIKGELTKTTI